MQPSNPPSNEIITNYAQFGVTTTTTTNNNNNSSSLLDNSNNNIDTSKLEQKKILHYNKHFGQFLGFTAFAFENEDTCNNDKIDIHVNKIYKVKETSPSSLVHFFAIHHGTHGKDVSTLLKKKLRYYLFKNNNYKDNPLQSISDAYQQIAHEINQAIPKSIPCGSSSISALVIENKVYIANIGNSKCIISCKGYTPFYNVTRCNNLCVNNEQSSSIKSSLTFEKNANAQLSPLLKQTKSITKHPNINANTNTTITPQKVKQTYTTYTVPEISEVNISNNIYFFMFVNDCIVKTLSTKALMLITYNTISHSLQNECTYEQMCSNVINQICNEVIAKGCKSTLSVLFIPVMNFVYLYNKSNTNVIRDIIEKIEQEHDNHEYIYPKCVIHDQRSVSMFSTVIHHNPQTSTFVNNDHTSKNTSPYLEKRIRENTLTIGEHYNSNMKTFETYLSVINKENNKKHCNNNKNKKKLLCGCFT
jgi:serine/threonine protein phosphatase PrpC